MCRFGGTEGYYKNLVPHWRNEIGLIPRGLAPRIINFKDFLSQKKYGIKCSLVSASIELLMILSIVFFYILRIN